ncbi:hypothetical protein PP427_gp036 [Salmonella phage KM16]|uniref:hypothetical protein n=1 Tax=Salmonella phage KM16 TaxID=2797303 RepID=UPI00249047B4|nr:hypothetical protein PP427_gp036 [Salmonella phage KM16]
MKFELAKFYAFRSNSSRDDFERYHHSNEDIVNVIEANGGVFEAIQVNSWDAVEAVRFGLTGKMYCETDDSQFYLSSDEAGFFIEVEPNGNPANPESSLSKIDVQMPAANDEKFEDSEKMITDDIPVPHTTLVITNLSEAISAYKMLKGIIPDASL